ncbi:MAG: 2-iminoacetate synthase ThiH [Candidatus Omnitrophica bacterium]|nr:2-iminoacetate synthase ThiH [Candidatus Omnitrophota bacterium]
MIAYKDIQSILLNPDPALTEELARNSYALTRRQFGRTIVLYAPIYLSNYCSSHCTYCGFNSKNKIRRVRLNPEQMDTEMRAVAQTGIENILLLTGESYQATPTNYLIAAAQLAKKYFTSISLEVHPMDIEEYQTLFLNGVDGVTVYQETYDRQRYMEVHVSGKKSDYDFRYGTPERAALGGMRQISLGVLLGLADDVAAEIHALYEHLRFMEKHYPGVEYSLSFPRIKTIKGRDFALCNVDDIMLTKIICLTRLEFPRVGINLSTREHPRFRDHMLGLGITRISAGSNTAVGGYELEPPEKQEPQFDISDNRSVAEVVRLLKNNHFDPVFTDWRAIENG